MLFGKVMKKAFSYSLLVLIMITFNAISQDDVNVNLPRIFSYQGLLTNTDGTTYDGTYTVTFEITSSDEQQTLFTETVNSLEISNGLINHNIGSVAENLDPLIFHDPVKLLIIIDGDTLTPYTDITLVPIAMNSIYAQSLRSDENPINIQNKLKFTGTDTNIVIISESPGPYIYIEQKETETGNVSEKKNNPLNGTSNSPVSVSSSENPAISGEHTGEDISGSGVYGNSTHGNGVRGYSYEGTGVSGECPRGIGVTGTSRDFAGVYGSSEDGHGVRGSTTNGNGGSFTSANGWGVFAYGREAQGAAWFIGKVKIDGEFECNGVKIDEEGEVYANSFHINADDGTQKMAATSDGNLTAAGNIHSEGTVTSDDGFETPEGMTVFPDGTVGVVIDINSEDGIVFSDPSDLSTIMQFDGEGNWSSDGSVDASGDSNFGNVLVSGDLWVEGAKNAVVETKSYGKRKVYCDESTEVYFFDRGEGKLENGEAVIYLDPVFLETITINEQHKMLVQITPASDCNGLFVAERLQDRFIVKELMNGKSNASFMWEVAAKRKGYENDDLEEIVNN